MFTGFKILDTPRAYPASTRTASVSAKRTRGESSQCRGVLPSPASSQVRVGPVALGEPERRIVDLLGSLGQKGINERPAFLIYSDAHTVVLFNFNDSGKLARIVVNPGPAVNGHRLPPRIPSIDRWRWAGGEVSKPPTISWLRKNKYWRANPGVPGKWLFNGFGCTGSASYYNYGGYTFQMGPIACNGHG